MTFVSKDHIIFKGNEPGLEDFNSIIPNCRQTKHQLPQTKSVILATWLNYCVHFCCQSSCSTRTLVWRSKFFCQQKFRNSACLFCLAA